MSDLILKSLDVANFRSIRGRIHAPLDAKVILLHGENGAGKTSLLSAIELALTGKVRSLERADPNYEKQLLHRLATNGSVLLKAISGRTERTFEASVGTDGAKSLAALSLSDADFFRERAFLPQSLLGQLLQIYQDSGKDAGSPLAEFVSKLLALDRLDALEAGLKPLADVRNVRKSVDGWLPAENNVELLNSTMSDFRKQRAELDTRIGEALVEVTKLCFELGIKVEATESTLESISAAIARDDDSQPYARLSDQQRRLGSIGREIHLAQTEDEIDPEGTVSSIGADEASAAFSQWEKLNGPRYEDMRTRVEMAFPEDTVPVDPAEFARFAADRLPAQIKQLRERVSQARKDIARQVAAQDERDIALQQRNLIDNEIASFPSSAGSLARALSELTSFIDDDFCPVCDRNFGELGKSSLDDHVHAKVRRLSSSAERLLVLGRTRGELDQSVESLERELQSLAVRQVDPQILAEFDRRLSVMATLSAEVGAMIDALFEGGRLRAEDIAARRAVSRAESLSVALSSARETLNEFAHSIGAAPLGPGESVESAMERIDELLAVAANHFEERIIARRELLDRLSTIRTTTAMRSEIEVKLVGYAEALQHAEASLQRAQTLREQGNGIRNAVDAVRSGIIRKEFNDRLNRLWRDLFVRLAPGEPFVPAFRIPASSTQRLEPKLITEHRDGGGSGGTPGVMLSAGNLNTAALTLFIALHLSVPCALPWLILDDPVQSMDDVHIAHFAALLRTLSKEHGRQVMIAVHDRQLFEYLKLELSPAFPEDSLLTLELSRGSRRDSLCIATRHHYQEEAALVA